ncbi:uncharacterized protein LOC122002211 isoform X2 [Zingiber officinale]|uniref:uncharacterized protein LOC122002211 isoform X2 n=1 Tax=Zingiber officinale TaxID=94328 RepID=UPI001C4CB080|nr:uncharacterized protein LOC122002211 isoform X2 [Zingiber officinale]
MLDGNGNILSCRLEVPFVMRGENLNNNEIRNGLEGNKIKIGCRLQWEVKDKADFCCYTKVFADVASDALQHCKSRQAAPVKDKIEQPKDKRLVLTMDDLSKALQEETQQSGKKIFGFSSMEFCY